MSSSRGKGWLMLVCGMLNAGNAGFVRPYSVSAAWADLVFAAWCLGWGFWWLYEGKKQDEQ